MRIEFLKDEVWYGGAAALGVAAPFDAAAERTIDMTTSAGFPDAAAPLFLSNRGRIIYSTSPLVIRFCKGAIETDRDVILTETGKDLPGAQSAAAEKYFQLGAMPDEFFMNAPQYNTWIELMYNQNQKDILEYAHSLIDSGMQPGIFMIDEGWSPDYGDFDFCARKFPDPQAMIDELHAMGFKIMLWVTPLISPDGYAFREIEKQDILLKNSDGTIALRRWWNGFSCVLDLSNPKCCEWFAGKLDGIIEKYGVDGFKFDSGNAYLYKADDVACRVQYPLEHSKSFDLFCARYPFNELRLVYDCPGQPIVCRLVDKQPDWASLASLVPNMLAQSLIGYPYGCPDMIGGGVAGAFKNPDYRLDEEMYLRWLEASVLCPMMQFSVSPKRILSPEAFEKVLAITKLHEKYAGLIVGLAREAACTGAPIMRYMEYAFPGQGFEHITDQFMLGDRLLVAPVVTQGATSRKVKLPAGKWSRDGDELPGGCEIELPAEIGNMIILEKIG